MATPYLKELAKSRMESVQELETQGAFNDLDKLIKETNKKFRRECRYVVKNSEIEPYLLWCASKGLIVNYNEPTGELDVSWKH